MKISDFLAIEHSEDWHEIAEGFFKELITSRFGASGLSAISLRVPKLPADKAPFAAILKKDSPVSGGYGGTSFVVFPGASGSFFSLVVGTQGLAPDEDILARPGHARYGRAFATWVNSSSDFQAWAKSDPVRIDQPMPASTKDLLSGWPAALQRYGNVLYLVARPSTDTFKTERWFLALLDFYMNERGIAPLTASKPSSDKVRQEIQSLVFSSPTQDDVHQLLTERKYLILEGPPGTGKTEMALHLKATAFQGNGAVHQFHPTSSYEQFVGGLAPVESGGQFGFRAVPGILMTAARAAAESHKPFLLVLDEINRADLARVLGEALFLFEFKSEERRAVSLPYDFGTPYGNSLSLPPNLYVLGTMNSSDRSTAILDLAVRRRFAFATLWPRPSVVSSQNELAFEAFRKLERIFFEEASASELQYLPGHAYFIADSTAQTRARVKFELRPLLVSYLTQGLVPTVADSLDAYIQWLDTL